MNVTISRPDGFGAELPQEKLAEYMKDYRSDDCEATEFWSYVAGRQHKEKPCPPPTPIKAQWVKHED